ncbi:MAG: ArsR family transcriptional regulator [Dehalococcoidia bacterium]|nr:ArsR family transcriptional regulator [Dehalococcoidia bacterium]
MQSPLDTLPATRRKLIIALRMDGELSSDEAASRLGLSPGAARQHLMGLRAAGLVSLRELRDGPGRPRHLFRLTPEANTLFPRANAAFVKNLLAAVAKTPDEVRAVVNRMCEMQVAKVADQLEGKPLGERLELVVQAFEHDGFLPAMRQLPDKRWQLSLFNCPLLDIAEDYPAFCDAEVNCVARMAFARVERVGLRISGQRACTYLIGPEQPELPVTNNHAPTVSEPVTV